MPARVASIVAAAIVLSATTLAAPWLHLGERVAIGDVRHYDDIAIRIVDGSLPYHDFFLEYPPGALPIFLAPAVAGTSPGSYGPAFQWIVFALALLTIAVVARGAALVEPDQRRIALATTFVAGSPALLGQVFFLRYDLLPALLTAVAVTEALQGRHRLAGGALGLGVAAKVYPVVLLPLLIGFAARDRGRKGATASVLWFSGTFAALVVPFVVLAPGGVAFSVRVQFTRALEVESLGGSLLLCAHRLGLYTPHVFEGLSSELVGRLPQAVGAAETFLLTAALLAVWFWFWRSPRSGSDLVVASAAATSATVTFDKVVSPQYLVWLFPLVAMSPRRTAAWTMPLLASASLLTLAYFPGRFHDLRHLGGTAWTVLARDAVLLVLTAVLLLEVRGRAHIAERR